MRHKSVVLGCLGILVMMAGAQADIVALKRTATLTAGNRLDSRFTTAITDGTITVYSGPEMAADTDFYSNTGWSPQNCYLNYGGKGGVSAGSPFFLSKFAVQALPGFAGSHINKAQLRFHYGSGNTGLTNTGYVISSDWTEGTKTGQYPGAAGGASFAHPNGHNTGANQNSDGGTTAPLKSWANNDWFAVAKDVSTFKVTAGAHNAGADYVVYDVTAIVQLWADGVAPNYGFCTYDSGLNYTIQFSENATADSQPVLCIDYDRHAAPTAVTDLGAGNADWFKVDLTWTAPSAVPSGRVGSYDIRYSTGPITDDASFDAASPCPGTMPAPAAPGTQQTFTVRGLAAETTYYFAIKSTDAQGLASSINTNGPVSITTPAMTAPDRIGDLLAAEVHPNHAVLTWTAVAAGGKPTTDYDIRYSTSPIATDEDFTNATAVPAVPAPKAPGSAESLAVHGLTPATSYWFAIKVADGLPNWSVLSNVATFQTLPADISAPEAITDLRLVSAPEIHNVFLAWTAPADVGSAGMAGYDVRYSTADIDDSNWDSAARVTCKLVPAAPGTTEHFTVSGLDPDTSYYFAIKGFDYAEPANVSPLSNTTSAKTMLPVIPVVVHNPWLANDRVADTRTISTMGATYVNSYTPQGVVAPASDEQKAINIYNNQKRRLYHWADTPPETNGNNDHDPTYCQNVFGWALCYNHAAQARLIALAAGLQSHIVRIPGHQIYEVQYGDGTWHLYDTMTTMYVFNRANPPAVASPDEIKADRTILTSAVAEGRACPGFLLCGDDVNWYADGVRNYYTEDRNYANKWNGNMDLRLGQVFRRTWESWANQYPAPATNADSIAGKDPPYHHEASKDYKDYVNMFYWEPYGFTQAQNTALNIGHSASYRRWANGTDTLVPDFRSAGYQDLLYSSTNIATYNDDNLTPDLHPAAVNTTAEAVFRINVPFYITDASFSGDFVKTNVDDVCNVQVAPNMSGAPGTWSTVWSASALGTTHVDSHSLRTNVFDAWTTWFIKIQMKSTAAKGDAGVSNFVVTTIFEHNKGCMAYLDRGVNNITLTFDNPAELMDSRNLIHVTYKWKEYDGAAKDWTVDRQFDGYAVQSPATFTITTGGDQKQSKLDGLYYDTVPRTEYIQLEVVPPVPDSIPPAQIADLALNGSARSRSVPLTWTATGDDDSTGTAIAYDLRYSTAGPIGDDAAFDAATKVAGVPSPKVAGSTEAFAALYLQPGTTYYFAIKAIDKGVNRSPLSNCLAVATPASAGVGDLAAEATTFAKASLTWTAIDDGSLGAYASYDLRYSTTGAITDEAGFDAATPVSGLPAPKAPGQSEGFAVTWLKPSTTYYFALKAIDIKGSPSPLSNCASATTGPAASVSDLQAGLPGATKIPLTWTAIDDGVTGTQASYDLRYSTAGPITTDEAFNAATPAAGLAAPRAAGQMESFLVTGLSQDTTYHFAIKAIDAKGTRSPLSNPVSATTTIDTVAPRWIGNLKGTTSHAASAVDLAWAAPADYTDSGAGPFPAASYQLRYSTSPILWNDGDATWNAATAVTIAQTPKAPGVAETFSVTVPTGGTTYYFCLKAVDDAGNVSEVSNCAAARSSTYGDVILQSGVNGYSGCMDTYIDQGTANYGTNTRMTLCGYGDGNFQRGMIRFDVSGIAGMNVTKATLCLYAYNASQCKGSTGFYGVYPFTHTWVDSGANWNNSASGTAWNTPGGDFDPTPDATAAKQGAASVPCWYNWDVTARVQSWLAGTSTNYGWMVKCTDESLSNQDQIYQCNIGSTALRPKLVISDLATPVACDFNGDGGVDVVDLLILVDSFGAVCGTDRSYDPQCDINADGSVDVVDLLSFVESFGQ